jgi:ribonuclease HI
LFWGQTKKYSLEYEAAFTDGSANKTNTEAGFSIVFARHSKSPRPYYTFQSRIPRDQTINRVEAFGVLGALVLTNKETPLTIHCVRKPLVDQINRFKLCPPQLHQWRKISDRSVVFRILEKLKERSGPTFIRHVKAHMRDKTNCQELNHFRQKRFIRNSTKSQIKRQKAA